MAGFVPPPPPPAPPAPPKPDEKVDYLDLPCPIPYEEIHREALMSLKPELFEGMRFDFTKGLNQKFSLSHSVFMGPTEIPSQSSETIKIPTAHYEFGANFIDPKLMLFGRILTDGRLNARVKCDLTENLTLKANAQLTSEPHMSHGMVNFDYKITLATYITALDGTLSMMMLTFILFFPIQGGDYRTQLQLGNGALFGASYIQKKGKGNNECKMQIELEMGERGINCSGRIVWRKESWKLGSVEAALDGLLCQRKLGSKHKLAGFGAECVRHSPNLDPSLGVDLQQSVTPYLSLGGEVFWAGQHRKSGIGYAARYNTDKMVATGQVASTGMVALSYVQKVSEKVSLASDFMYNYMSRDVTASFGYDYILRQCRLRGKIDSNGCTAAFLEERLNMGLNFILSAEVRTNAR
ncbi:Mitochondrial import receptor subunit TOM40-1 [Vitis vinifera]|uniref:Mitochondrial import receptor subunit TOM40-1 n=1 Tax=Vitis vinifera TaxID=29760 RepID=A0A438GJF1_VITVI|nr:Mitochondrial import receptor subunit TOM40-1 [Vitis vinifera]